MHQFAGRRALGAVRAAGDRRIPARLLADPHAVDHFGRSRCSRPSSACRCSCGWWRRTPAIDPAASALRTLASGSAPTAARPPAARPERRRKVRRSRCAADWLAKRGGERAAACLTFCSLDQHGRLLSSSDTGSRDRTSSRDRFPCSGPCAFHRCSRCPRWRRVASGPRRWPQHRRLRRAREGNHGGRPFDLFLLFHRIPSLGFALRAVSRRQRKRFRFYFHEHAAERANASIQIGRFRLAPDRNR